MRLLACTALPGTQGGIGVVGHSEYGVRALDDGRKTVLDVVIVRAALGGDQVAVGVMGVRCIELSGLLPGCYVPRPPRGWPLL